jgi:hypothetical protein
MISDLNRFKPGTRKRKAAGVNTIKKFLLNRDVDILAEYTTITEKAAEYLYRQPEGKLTSEEMLFIEYISPAAAGYLIRCVENYNIFCPSLAHLSPAVVDSIKENSKTIYLWGTFEYNEEIIRSLSYFEGGGLTLYFTDDNDRISEQLLGQLLASFNGHILTFVDYEILSKNMARSLLKTKSDPLPMFEFIRLNSMEEGTNKIIQKYSGELYLYPKMLNKELIDYWMQSHETDYKHDIEFYGNENLENHLNVSSDPPPTSEMPLDVFRYYIKQNLSGITINGSITNDQLLVLKKAKNGSQIWFELDEQLSTEQVRILSEIPDVNTLTFYSKFDLKGKDLEIFCKFRGGVSLSFEHLTLAQVNILAKANFKILYLSINSTKDFTPEQMDSLASFRGRLELPTIKLTHKLFCKLFRDGKTSFWLAKIPKSFMASAFDIDKNIDTLEFYRLEELSPSVAKQLSKVKKNLCIGLTEIEPAAAKALTNNCTASLTFPELSTIGPKVMKALLENYKGESITFEKLKYIDSESAKILFGASSLKEIILPSLNFIEKDVAELIGRNLDKIKLGSDLELNSDTYQNIMDNYDNPKKRKPQILKEEPEWDYYTKTKFESSSEIIHSFLCGVWNAIGDCQTSDVTFIDEAGNEKQIDFNPDEGIRIYSK